MGIYYSTEAQEAAQECPKTTRQDYEQGPSDNVDDIITDLKDILADPPKQEAMETVLPGFTLTIDLSDYDRRYKCPICDDEITIMTLSTHIIRHRHEMDFAVRLHQDRSGDINEVLNAIPGYRPKHERTAPTGSYSLRAEMDRPTFHRYTDTGLDRVGYTEPIKQRFEWDAEVKRVREFNGGYDEEMMLALALKESEEEVVKPPKQEELQPSDDEFNRRLHARMDAIQDKIVEIQQHVDEIPKRVRNGTDREIGAPKSASTSMVELAEIDNQSQKRLSVKKIYNESEHPHVDCD